MLKTLIKKQFVEVFRGYFYDAKKNRMRSKGGSVGYILLFLLIMVGFLGGVFTGLSLTLCGGLAEAGMGWLYFLLMGGIAVLLGAFGSVFNTYAGLYLAKDNDLLLSLPIPVRTIIAARLVNVYLLGAMYSAVAMIPALAVYWITVGATAARVICGLALFLIVTLIVLLLACALGWAVAKISLRLRHKSFVTVLVSLLFIAAYYFVYFRANLFVRELLQNAGIYGERIKGAAYGLYLFGRVGEGDWAAAAVFTAVTAALLAIVWTILTRSFLSIATAGGKTKKARYSGKAIRQKKPFRALLDKEFARFAASSNYMLNCGLGILLIPASGVLLLIMGPEVAGVLDSVFASRPGAAAVLLCAGLSMLASMNDIAAPSVSLEGKSLWIPQSLPVEPKTVLRAKAAVQLILTAVPMLFAAVCAALILRASPSERLLTVVTPVMYSVFSSVYDAAIGIRMPLLNWTNEVAPIKQSGAVTLAVFSSWGICVAFAGLYLFLGYRIGAAVYLLLWTALLAAASLLLLRRLDTKGADTFAAL